MARIINQMDTSTTDLPPGVSNAGGDGAKFADPMIPAPADGDVCGDDRDLPNRGARSGVIWGDTYKADLEAGFSALGSAHMDSDPADLRFPKGDADLRFSAATHTADDKYGEDRGLRANDESDPADMHVAQPQSTAQEMTTGPKGPMSNSGAGPRGATMAEGSPAEEAAESPAEEADEKRKGQGDSY